MGKKITVTQFLFVVISALALTAFELHAQGQTGPVAPVQPDTAVPSVQTIDEVNKRLLDLAHQAPGIKLRDDYRIGPEDLLDVNVFEVPELTRVVRVTGEGFISLPLVGRVRAAGLSAGQLQDVIAGTLRDRYVKDPQVSIFVREFHSQPVMIMGAVTKAGLYQLQGSKTLLEMLAEAGGLTAEAGQIVRITRRKLPTGKAAGAAETGQAESGGIERIEVDMEQLLTSGNLELNVAIYGGDVINVEKAGIVYVTGEVARPGGYVLKNGGRERLTVLQVLALAGGPTRIAAKKQSRIIRMDENGQRREITLNLDKVLAGKVEDPMLHADDILFLPGSTAKPLLSRTLETTLATLSGIIIFRR